MKYLHDRNIIHRDLKPDNVLLDDNFCPLITDFGLSKIFETGHSKSQSMYGGTLIYMAPEVIEGEKYDTKADVYSFAILMFKIVTDLVPYPKVEEMNDFQFRIQIVQNDLRPKFKFHVKQSIYDLIVKCWSKNPKDRPTFKEIYEKLSSDKNYFLDDVDEDEVLNYIDEIKEANDPVEKLLKLNETLEKERDKSAVEIKKLKIENPKLKTESKQLEREKCQFEDEVQRLMIENK